jgi:hypothetical protein
MRRALVLIVLAGCIGQTPDDQEKNSIVMTGRRGPTHNPGTPCLLCHDFAMAGTIYQRATDENGTPGVVVTMTDDANHTFQATSNETGNFYVTTGGGPSTDESGHTTIPWDLVYPVHVTIEQGSKTKTMRSVIHQWGSCGECHKPDKGATSAGRIYLESP